MTDWWAGFLWGLAAWPVAVVFGATVFWLLILLAATEEQR